MVQISACDSLDDWSTVNGDDALDTTDKQEGIASIAVAGFGAVIDIEETYNPAGTWNWGAYDHFTFWFKTSDRSDVKFRIWSGVDPNDNYIQWSQRFLRQVKANDTWYRVKLYLDDYDVSVGAPNLLAVEGLVVKVLDSLLVTSFWLDDIRIDEPDPVKIKIGAAAGLDYVSDDAIETDIWRDSLSGIGRWQIILENPDNKWGGLFLPDEDTEIRINGTLMMNGYVDDVVPFLEPGGHYKNRIKVLGRDYGMDLAQLYLTASYPNDNADDIVDRALAATGSEITYASPTTAPVIDYEFNRTYLADGIRDICKLINYDFYIEDDGANPKRLQFFAIGDANQYLDGGGGRPDIDLTAVSGSATNNILRLEKGEKLGFSIRNYIEAHAGSLQDHWTDMNAADWTPGLNCTVSNEMTIFLVPKSAIKVIADLNNTDLIIDLDFSGTRYGYTTLDMSERNEGSFLGYKHYTGIVNKVLRIRLKDSDDNWIEFFKFNIQRCDECTDEPTNDVWRKIVFPYGEGLEIKAAGSFVSDYWQYIAPAVTFNWSAVETIRFTSDPMWPRNQNDYFIVDGLSIPTIEVISIVQDAGSQISYGVRMLPIYTPNIKNQVELDAFATDQKNKNKDPLETIKITASGQVGTRYAGQSLDVQAPSHGLAALTRYRIVKLHHQVVKSSSASPVVGHTFLTEYDLIKHEINPTQVIDPNRFAIYKTPIEAIMRDMRDKLARLTKITPRSISGGAGGSSGSGGSVPYYVSGNDIVFYDTYNMLRPETTGSIDLGSNAIKWGNIWGVVHYSDFYMSDLECPICGESFKPTDALSLTVIDIVEEKNELNEQYREIRCVPTHRRCPILPRITKWFCNLFTRKRTR